MSQTFYINLFHNGLLKYSGFKKSLEPDENGGVRPVMVPINSFRKAVRFPYRLDRSENIRKESVNGTEVAFLVPSRNVPNLTDQQFEDSIYYRLFGDSDERVQELRDQVRESEDVKGKLRKQLRELREEEEERDKGGSGRGGSSKRLRCNRCGSVSSESAWDSNMGNCPSCNRVHKDNPEEVEVQ